MSFAWWFIARSFEKFLIKVMVRSRSLGTVLYLSLGSFIIFMVAGFGVGFCNLAWSISVIHYFS